MLISSITRLGMRISNYRFLNAEDMPAARHSRHSNRTMWTWSAISVRFGFTTSQTLPTISSRPAVRDTGRKSGAASEFWAVDTTFSHSREHIMLHMCLSECDTYFRLLPQSLHLPPETLSSFSWLPAYSIITGSCSSSRTALYVRHY